MSAAPDRDRIEWIRERVEACGDAGVGLTASLARDLLAALDAAERENANLREIVATSLPALGCHARDFSQDALVAACKVTGSDPRDWTHHPDVLERVLAPAEEKA